jgi:hypothetical protein
MASAKYVWDISKTVKTKVSSFNKLLITRSYLHSEFVVKGETKSGQVVLFGGTKDECEAFINNLTKIRRL